MNFDSFSFDRRIAAGIAACGFDTPTPVQQKALSPALQGRDVLGLAQTGSGKTAAFVLPILQRLIANNAGRRGPVRALVLAPTRELALQTHETFITLGKETGYRSATVYGGVGMGPQIKALKNTSIVVACPGRLLDMIGRGHADLSRVDMLVLDEADHMMDMGFLPDVRKIIAELPADRQNLLFSATMPSEIRSLANGLLHDPVTVEVEHSKPADTVSHAFYHVPSSRKANFLQALIKDIQHESVLVFTRTKFGAKNLARKLEQSGWRAIALQGNLSQNRRQQAMDGFRRGRYQILVATDIAARGIDCENISHVINYDAPDTADTYIHRIGRTGRATRTGEALSLITDADKILVRAIERILGGRVERRELQGFDYGPADAGAAGRDGRNSTNQEKPRRDKPSRSRGKGSGAGKAASARNTDSAAPAQNQGAGKKPRRGGSIFGLAPDAGQGQPARKRSGGRGKSRRPAPQPSV